MQEVRYLFRATRHGEANSEGDLVPKNEKSDTTMSDSIEHGNKEGEKGSHASKYMHCTKNRFVALYYAEEFPNLTAPNTHEIVCIDLSKIPREKVIDVSVGAQRLSKTAWNFARA